MLRRLATSLALAAALSLASCRLKPAQERLDFPDDPLPVVIWHGLGDNYAAEGLASIGELVEKIHPGTYVYNIRLDDNPSADASATFFGNVTTQLEKVCADLAADNILSTAPAIDAIGFSQGGQFLRGYVERCNQPPVRSLLTFGSQHNGISEFEQCASTDWLCRSRTALLTSGTWTSLAQSRLVPAQYFRDPAHLDKYLQQSNFLADINNERTFKNSVYRTNLASLKNFAMYLFSEDETVVPKESAWFAEVDDGEVTMLHDRPIYKEDWIGLRELDDRGALSFQVLQGKHMHLSEAALADAFDKYLGP
jgi:palmitoyl-protein thioesterase